jgi:hypothetical protein
MDTDESVEVLDTNPAHQTHLFWKGLLREFRQLPRMQLALIRAIRVGSALFIRVHPCPSVVQGNFM